MTAVAALRLVQENLVGLDADVADILPELREKEILISYDSTTKNATFVPRKKKITLRYLQSLMHLCMQTSRLYYSIGACYHIPLDLPILL